jgi:hypothetical protein
MHGSIHVSGTSKLVKNRGAPEGVPILTRGSPLPLPGVGPALPPLRACPRRRLNDLRIVPSGANQPQFPALLARDGEVDAVSDENRRDFGDFDALSGEPIWSGPSQLPR